MGCTQSNSEGDADNSERKRAFSLRNLPVFGTKSSRTLSQDQIEERIDRIKETCVSTFGDVSLRYAYLSQRGYYPNDKRRPNEDSYSITHNFAGRVSDAFFGVYDGHGEDGAKCSRFVRDGLPSLLAKDLSEARSLHGGDSSNIPDDRFETVIHEAHKKINQRMHQSQQLDDSWSGTTSISVHLNGNEHKITVNNVGDSRAVLGSGAAPQDGEKVSPSLVASALSCDQTPWRRDERERIKKNGGRIMSYNQMFRLSFRKTKSEEKSEMELWDTLDHEKVLGEEIDDAGDPPRVWLPKGQMPGAAFTRSLGDGIAERKAGLFAEPEILMRKLTPQDKIIFLASDGIFEFLTNQHVIDICAECTDPLDACRKVASKSYNLWMEKEPRTDDMTMICIFVDSICPALDS